MQREGANKIPPERIGIGEMDIDRFDRSKRLGWFDLSRVTSAKVAVIGCGALGNEVAKDLVLSGFRHIILVDMDKVEGSNLNRCVFFIDQDAVNGTLKVDAVKRGALSLSRDVDVEVHASRVEDLDSGVLLSCDVILGCLDNIAARVHLNGIAMANRVPYIDGATDGLIGKVQVVRENSACLECNLNRSHMRILNLRQSCTGDDITLFEPRVAGEITTTSIIAAVQVREALKVVHGLDDKVLNGVFYYDGMRNETSILETEVNPRCPHHSTIKGDSGQTRDPLEEVERSG